jgi:hypothetical protein
MNIELSKNDAEFITLLLERELKSTMVERFHTATNDYKKLMKDKEAQIEQMLERFHSVH